jgi:hypothetical protein
MAVELFHYRGAAKDGGTLEYVFDAGEQHPLRSGFSAFQTRSKDQRNSAADVFRRPAA